MRFDQFWFGDVVLHLTLFTQQPAASWVLARVRSQSEMRKICNQCQRTQITAKELQL